MAQMGFIPRRFAPVSRYLSKTLGDWNLRRNSLRDLAPHIERQRLLIEGLYSVDVDRELVESFLIGVAEHLELRTYGSPIIHAPGGLGKEENEGFDAFIPLIDSGISLYVWSNAKFFAAVLFTCKAFDTEQAINYTEDFFLARELEHQLF